MSATFSSIGNSGRRGLSPYPKFRCNNFFIPAICRGHFVSKTSTVSKIHHIDFHSPQFSTLLRRQGRSDSVIRMHPEGISGLGKDSTVWHTISNLGQLITKIKIFRSGDTHRSYIRQSTDCTSRSNRHRWQQEVDKAIDSPKGRRRRSRVFLLECLARNLSYDSSQFSNVSASAELC